jgi:uncharacterized membrane protein
MNNLKNNHENTKMVKHEILFFGFLCFHAFMVRFYFFLEMAPEDLKGLYQINHFFDGLFHTCQHGA